MTEKTVSGLQRISYAVDDRGMGAGFVVGVTDWCVPNVPDRGAYPASCPVGNGSYLPVGNVVVVCYMYAQYSYAIMT